MTSVQMSRVVRLLALSLVLPLLSTSAALAQVSTLTVPATGNPIDDGRALLAAVDQLAASERLSSTRLVLEAGVYDLGTEQLILPGLVDLVGAGRDQTVIRSACSGTGSADGTVSVLAGVVATISDLAIENLQSFNDGIGLQIASGDLSLSRVDVRVSGSFLPQAIVVSGGSPTLDDVALGVVPSAFGPSFGFRGLVVLAGAPTVDRLTVTADATATASPEAIFLAGGAPSLGTVTVDIEGSAIASGIIVTGAADARVTDAVLDVASSYRATGVSANGLAHAVLSEVDSLASAGSDMGCALATDDSGAVIAQLSAFVAAGTSADQYGLCNRGEAEIHDSVLSGSGFAVVSDDPEAQAMIVDSELEGGVAVAAGTVECDGAWDDTGTLDSSCH